jgi:hypothetical protein
MPISWKAPPVGETPAVQTPELTYVSDPQPVDPLVGRSWPAQLSESQIDEVYELAGVPQGWRSDLKSIAACESEWSPGAIGDSGNSLGLHQMNRTWFAYGGLDAEQWADPVINTRAALAAAQYDVARGYPVWRQWSCQPP